MKLGFLGLGIMGSGMARNLLRAGYAVTVWNRAAEKCAPFVKDGARLGASPRAVVAENDITFAMVSDPAAAEAVALGPDGAREGAGPGHDYIDCSTVDAATAIHIGEAIVAAGARFLEAPVSGTKKPAEDGTLIFLTGGDATLYRDVAPALDKMGKKRVFLGVTGQGARMKLIVNMIMGSMMAVLGEGLALGRKSGLDGAALLDVLDAGAMACPMFKGKGAMVLKDDFSTNFPLKHQQKDLRLAVAMASELGQPATVTEAAYALYSQALARGYGGEDMCAVARIPAEDGAAKRG